MSIVSSRVLKHHQPRVLAVHSRYANMADDIQDHDSAFGDDDFSWIAYPMFPPAAAIAGTKRHADVDVLNDRNLTHRDGAEHMDLAISCCPASCPDVRVRPTKRRALAAKVSAYHDLTTNETHPIDADCQFPDDCFEKFCQECNLDTACPPDCALPVPCPADTECSTPDACWDPHCDEKEKECVDDCVDPDCTKLSCPQEPCLCHKCDALPDECHFAHTAPTTTGAIYCYDNAPCHFQENYHGHSNNALASFETYPCFSSTHGYMNPGVDTASSAPTPVLSHSNYTSLESAFTTESSPGPPGFSNCFLGVLGDHCHIDNSCCHGQKRACGDCPSASPHQLDLWNSSIAQGNGLANNFMSFGLASNPTSPVTTDPGPFSHNFNSPMLNFNQDNSWMFEDASMMPFQSNMLGANKLDYLTAAVQQDILKPTSALRGTAVRDDTPVGSSESQQHTCRWYVRLK
jgi:hypothetical protein